ncbi:MAG: RNA polymerase sigma factor [Bacteroidetes bacterium]|jgi:RNA polymerase sigma factor (sigma-70 family)|nr:RNA polymerase sigma factor [Bacteroidota bacterium]
MTDHELIAGCLRQDRTCQEALYKRFYGKMLGVTMRYARDRDEARDMLQEGFIKVFTSISNFSGKGSFEGWVRRIVVNTSIDHLRKNKHEYMIVSSVHSRDGDLPDAVDEADENELLQLSEEQLIACIQQLSPAYRAVFNLYVMENLPHKEISERLGISEGTSKSNLAKARYQLKKILYQKIRTSHGEQTFTR